MTDDEQKKEEIELIGSYDGVMSSSASHRTFLNIEPNKSVRPQHGYDDYYSFRPGEKPPTKEKEIISACMNAYEKVGIIKNVIDLMGDFGSQGISLVHENPSIQNFYRRWWHLTNATERSERFLNTLFRCGNVIIKRRKAKLNKKTQKEFTKGDVDVDIPKMSYPRREIPFVYDFINPLIVDVIGGAGTGLSSDKNYRMKITTNQKKTYKDPKSRHTLPLLIQNAIEKGQSYVDLDNETISVFHYKKDDWQSWAQPMIHSILDDITMLEKMKLADMSALDGAISNIRLWRIGDLEHKILPKKASIDRLRDILASNVGGGTMDLVWGPEIDFKESNTQVFKFLGSEKYGPVLNSIYAGLGVPPTLTGLAGQSGGFTNNFISLKTLIERLEYGRQMLEKFWMYEIRMVQKAMSFAKPASIHYDKIIISDESAEKALLIQLADRNIISSETLRERFSESDNIEEARIKREEKKREKDVIPPKAGPYHNSQIEEDYTKLALQKDQIKIDQITDLKYDPIEKPEPQKPGNEKKKENPSPDNGRPKNSNDTTKRKQKIVNPRSKPGVANIMLWANSAQRTIADIVNPAIIDYYGKSNLRQLTKTEASELDKIKFTILANLFPLTDLTVDKVLSIIENNASVHPGINELFEKLMQEFIEYNGKTPSLDEIRHLQSLSYVSYHCD
jgi:hypothetical protein